MNLVNMVLRWGDQTPENSAIIERNRSISFQGLAVASAKAAAMLRHSGLKKGDAVLVLMPMQIELYTLLAGLWRAGLTALVVDPSAGKKWMSQALRRFPPSGFVGTPLAQCLRLFVPELRHGCRIWSTGFPVFCRSWSGWAKFPADERVEEMTEDDPALVTFTSGSTGTPKGVVRTHGFLESQHAAIAQSLDHRAGAVDLATLPIFALANLASGQTVLIPDGDLSRPGAIDPKPVLNQIQTHHPRSAVGSPAFFERLALEPKAFQAFESIYAGGGPVFPSLLLRLKNLSPHARLVAVFGSTEAEPIAEIALSEMTSDDLERQCGGKGLLAGQPVSGIDLAILPDRWGTPLPSMSQERFNQDRLPAESWGEIVVSGKHVLKGYLGGVGDADSKFRVDDQVWHRTGDAGYLDAQNRLWLLGRCSARVVDGHGTLYPFAVEAAAMSRKGVRRAALACVQGGRILALEMDDRENGADSELRSAFAWAHIDKFVRCKIPLDKRHNSKVDYKKLSRILGGNDGN